MPSKYYYLVSSLPYIVFGEEVSRKKEYFLPECKKWLSQDDLKTLLSVDAQNFQIAPQDRGLIREWKEFDSELRHMLTDARMAKKVSTNRRMPDLIKDIFDQKTPLHVERRFERIRWDFLDEKETYYHFDLNWLIVYFLKLQINERLSKFKRDEGELAFTETCEAVYG